MTHDERVYHHMYETNEGIAEHAERIAALEELCKELAEFLTEAEWLQWPELRAEMQRLGVSA